MPPFSKKHKILTIKNNYHKHTKKRHNKQNDNQCNNQYDKQKKYNQNIENIPDSLLKYLDKYDFRCKDGVDVMMPFSLKPYLHKNTILLGNQINGLGDILKIPSIKEKFETFFTYDYMNYLDYDNNKRRISISTSQHTFKGKPIILQGYLLITYFKNIYNSYMLDKLKILNTPGDKEYYFPESLPDDFPKTDNSSLSNITEIINQVFTIMKYLAIIISYGGIKKYFNIENAFEIIKVQFKLLSDNSVILERCIIKKDWFNGENNNMENKMLAEWLDSLIFRPILGNKLRLDLELSGVSLYKKDFNKKHKRWVNDLNTDNMTRSDFNNKFIVISAKLLYIEESHGGTINYKSLIKSLNKYGLKQDEFYSVGTKPAFIWFGFDSPPKGHDFRINQDLIIQHYNTLSYTSNYIGNTDSITDKMKLFFNIKKYFPDEYLGFIADSFLLSKNTVYKPGNIYIARPINKINPETGKKVISSFSGKGIMYIDNEERMKEAINGLIEYDNILISEYIRDPLLFKGKKFHLRIPLLVTMFNSVIKTYLFPDSLVRTAELPFVLDHFDSKEIHDTHLSSTDLTKEYIFPNDFTTEYTGKVITEDIKTKVNNEIEEIMRKVSIILADNIEKYPNVKNPCQLLGIDMMITDDFKPMLIECNARPGFALKKSIKYQKDFNEFIDRNILAPLFGSGNEETDEPLFVKKIKVKNIK